MSPTIDAFRRASPATPPKVHDEVYDHIVVGGSIAGVFAAYKLVRAGYKVLLLADKFQAPQNAVSHWVFGLDANTNAKAPLHRNAMDANNLIREALADFHEVIREEKIDCLSDMRYQLLGSTPKRLKRRVGFLERRMSYDPARMQLVEEADRVKMVGDAYACAMETDEIGQVNTHKFLEGLLEAIKRRGGDIREGIHYKNRQTKNKQGIVRVQTSDGIFQSRGGLLLGTGGEHLQKFKLLQGRLKKIRASSFYYSVLAMEIQLTPEDRKLVMPNGKEIAFCQAGMDEAVLTATGGDIIGGGIDRNGTMSFGWVWDEDASKRSELIEKIQGHFETVFPQLKGKYLFPDANGHYNDPDGRFAGRHVTFSYGTQFESSNLRPFVGPLNDKVTVHAALSSRACLQQWAIADAYVRMLQGNPEAYETFAGLNQMMPAAQRARQFHAMAAATAPGFH